MESDYWQEFINHRAVKVNCKREIVEEQVSCWRQWGPSTRLSVAVLHLFIPIAIL